MGYVAEATITHIGDQSISKVKFRRYHHLTDQDARFLRIVTSFGWLMRGIAFLLAEGLFGYKEHARAYLYLWKWILSDPSADGTQAQRKQ